MTSSLAKKRKRYYTMIYTYKQRRDKLRDRYGINRKMVNDRNVKLPVKYLEKTVIFNKKIKSWNRSIRRIDALSEKIGILERTVVEFTGESIINKTGYNVPNATKTAKYLYYKFGLENGIRGKELIEYLQIEITKRKEPTRYRTRFTNSFQTNPENKELWLRFKKFYERRIESESNRFISTKKTA